MFKTLDLFAGIGGFSLGLERTGAFETKTLCEIDPFAGAVLEKHWPDAELCLDIRDIAESRCDFVTAGFPCQDISEAKQGAVGISGEQSSLVLEALRIIDIVRPRGILLENSRRLRALGLDHILSRLNAIGYDAEWHCIPATSVGAQHTRDRIYIVAYPNGEPPLWPAVTWEECAAWPREPDVPRVAHGISNQPHRRRVLGNAVVPQIPELLGRAFAARSGIHVL